MRNWKDILNAWLRLNFILLVAFLLIRIIFHIYNADLLSSADLSTWMRVYGLGVQYDLAIILPVTTVLLPIFWLTAQNPRLRWVSGFSLLAIVPLLIISVADIPYFRFNSRRTTVEVFQIMADSMSAFSSFLFKYVLFFALVLALTGWVVWMMWRTRTWQLPASYAIGSGIVLVLLATNFGRILTPKNASFYVEPPFVPVAVNTPMTLGYSMLKGQEVLERKDYFTDEDALQSHFSIDHQLKSDSAFNDQNVVLFLMESVSREYLVDGHPNEAEMPFLRSIMDQSRVFTNAFANGTTSSYGLMSVLGGIPPFLDEPYFSSIYGDNRLLGIGSMLEKRGYTSAFFYGAEADHYGFRKNLALLGIDRFFSMEDYPGDAYDGNWGIYDEPFLEFTAEQLKAMPRPFFATHFNISTHFPYMVPDDLKDELPKGTLASHQSLSYYDRALKTFFRSIEDEAWYEETVFIFISDHWAKMREMEDKSSVGIYRIPFIVFDPSDPTGRTDGAIAQQVDVIPTVLDLLDYSGPWISFGSSLLDHRQGRFTYNEFEDIYRLIDSTYVLAYDENRERSFSLHNYRVDPLLQNNLIHEEETLAKTMERRIQAVIQTYNNRLLDNRLYPVQNDLINLGQ